MNDGVPQSADSELATASVATEQNVADNAVEQAGDGVVNASVTDSDVTQGADITEQLATGLDAGLEAPAAAPLAEQAPSWVEQMHLSQLQEWLEIGGPVVWLLAVLSVIALSIIVAKIIQFALVKPESKRRFERALEQIEAGDIGTAKQILGERHPLSNMFVFSVDQHPHLGGELLKEDITRRAMTYIEQLKSGLRPLEMIGVVSPLFGLLGTVLGMIEAFQQMQQAGSQVDPSVLSGGIWKALLTTAVGLCVALPAVMAHAWIDRKVERVGMMTNDYLTRLFVLLESKSAKAESERVS